MRDYVIFFDIGHTLVTGADQSPHRILGTRLHLPDEKIREVEEILMTFPGEELNDVARILGSVIRNRSLEEIRHVLSQIWDDQIECVREVPGATCALESLKKRGYQLGVISNIWHPFFLGFKKNCPYLLELLDFFILSYRIGHKKPALDIYKIAVKSAGLPAHCCWMIGDSYEQDIEPAKQVGYRTIWILNRPEREKSLLIELLRGKKKRPDLIVESIDKIPDLLCEQGEIQ